MALTACPDCGRQVSDRAPTCPGCGAPMERGTITTQATGKGPKAATGLGLLCFAVGAVLTYGADQVVPGVAAMSFGALVALVGQVTAWWRHG